MKEKILCAVGVLELSAFRAILFAMKVMEGKNNVKN